MEEHVRANAKMVLQQLPQSKALQTLRTGGTKVTDVRLANLKDMKELKKLSLFQAQVTDAGASPEAAVEIRNAPTLWIKITDPGARELQGAVPKLRFSEST